MLQIKFKYFVLFVILAKAALEVYSFTQFKAKLNIT